MTGALPLSGIKQLLNLEVVLLLAQETLCFIVHDGPVLSYPRLASLSVFKFNLIQGRCSNRCGAHDICSYQQENELILVHGEARDVDLGGPCPLFHY